MALFDELERLHHLMGRRIVLPTPPACQWLMEQAKASGLPLGHLFVLSRPLSPGIRGSYERESGNLWCHYDGGDENGANEVLLCILTLIAYAKLGFAPPATIEEDWEQARKAHQEAFALARTWQREDLFPASALEQTLAYDEYLYRCHVAAGELSGSLHPSVARRAYCALLELQQRSHWSDAQFEAALTGTAVEDEAANAVVLDFDRTWLRARWLLTSTRKRKEQPNPFGAFALAQTPRTASVLRSALEQVAARPGASAPDNVLQLPKSATCCSFFRVEDALDLPPVLEQVNAWLMKDEPTCFARAWWKLYADKPAEGSGTAAHLYQLRVVYEDDQYTDEASGKGGERPPRELWVLFPVQRRLLTVETAWQRFLLSWMTCVEGHCESFYAGLQTLWSFLEA